MRLSSMILTATTFLALAVPSVAKPAFVAKAKAAGIDDAKCVTCHTKMGAKDLNEVGTFAKGTEKNGEPDFAAVKKHIKK
ncbi:MAG: hypothetical protein P4L36_02160 [Holophaga sp.]|nr:hypothetical protein [Holophaga sp.]